MREYLFFFLLLAAICGCGTPPDLPPLAELKIYVTKNGSPAEGCFVTVHSDSLPNQYSCYGTLNSGGFLSLVTYDHTAKRKFSGAPVGPVKIGIRRDGNYGLEDPRKATQGMDREQSAKYAAERSKQTTENEKYVPMSLGDPLLSPIEFEVAAQNSNELTIELDDPKWDVKIDPKRLRKY